MLSGQLDVLAELGDIVRLTDLVAADDHPGPLFALTFDDDAPGHVSSVLPLLEERDLPATFFLSGRSLHGGGAYWWEVLEHAVRTRGVAVVAGELGVPGGTVAELAAACTGTEVTRQVTARYPSPIGTVLGADPLVRLASSRTVDVGFHTVDHPVLTTLDEGALDHALTNGRAELERVLGARTTAIAYPHGAADDRVRRCASRLGYRIGCTTAAHPYRPGRDRMRIGRWEPGPSTGDAFLARVLVVLNRASSPPG